MAARPPPGGLSRVVIAMSEAYLVACEDCAYVGGPYTGTQWKTPREHAQQAVGGHQAQYPSHDITVAPVTADGDTARWATPRWGDAIHAVADDPTKTASGKHIDEGWTYRADRPADWPVCRFCAPDERTHMILHDRLRDMDPEEVGG